MTGPTPAVDRYPLGRSDAETERLILQHQIYGPLTRRFLLAAGITAGMTVLDLGSGAGDVALLLAELVGPQGRVVGLDMNPDILERARSRAEATGWRNVTFHRADLELFDPSTDLDDDVGDVDAIVGRWVLMYLENPADLLRRLRTRLRPGGTVAFLESDLTTPVRSYPPAPLHDRLSRLLAADGTTHPDGQMGLKLPRTFADAGLPAPQMLAQAPVGGGADWPGYAYVAAGVRSLTRYLEDTRGVRPDDLDPGTLEQRLRDEVVDAHGMQILTTVIGAWATT